MKLHTIVASVAAAICAPFASGQLVINELMQSNVECIMDDMNEFPDSWVELYNAGSSSVNLSDYSIGVKDNVAKAYKLPSRSIAAHARIVVYCDKEATGLHTSFRLESGKDGAVYLFKGSDIVDKVTGMKKMPAPDVAYGRITDGADTWGYQAKPTPGAANCGTVYTDVLPEPEFSHAGRVASNAFTLTITAPVDAPEGTVVRYTTDGTEPTEQSRQCVNGFNVSRTTIVRAKLFCNGYLSRRSTAQSYIFFPRKMTLPIVAMTCDKRYFYDNKLGIYVEGNYSSNKKNYEYNWRRPVNVEIFMEPGEEAVVNQLCETRVKGGASRGAALKSLVLYANKRFGTKRFEYEFFPEDTPELTDWKSLELRNSGNDFDYLYFRDALIQRMMGRHADMDYQPYQPAIFMLNGEYKGMLNIRSRSNEDYIYTVYDGLEDIDMVENGWDLKSGSMESYEAFKAFYTETGHTYEEYAGVMDLVEYANLMIMNLFYDNKDFPGNNSVCWRPQAEGGLWRWNSKDTDFGMGLYGATATYKTFNWIYNPDYDRDHAWANGWDHTRLFRRLMDVPEFRDMFIDRCAVYMGDFMNARHTIEEMEKMRSVINYEYPNHRKLFNEWWPNYDYEFNSAKNWITNRTPFFYKHIAEYFKLGTPRTLLIDKDRTDNIHLTVNGVPMYYREFDGQYFEGRTLRVSGVTDEGLPVERWSVAVKTSAGTDVMNYNTPLLALTMPSGAQSVSITSVAPTGGIYDVEADDNVLDPSAPVEVYDMQGRHTGSYMSPDAARAALPVGMWLLRQGEHAVKEMVR